MTCVKMIFFYRHLFFVFSLFYSTFVIAFFLGQPLQYDHLNCFSTLWQNQKYLHLMHWMHGMYHESLLRQALPNSIHFLALLLQAILGLPFHLITDFVRHQVQLFYYFCHCYLYLH